MDVVSTEFFDADFDENIQRNSSAQIRNCIVVISASAAVANDFLNYFGDLSLITAINLFKFMILIIDYNNNYILYYYSYGSYNLIFCN